MTTLFLGGTGKVGFKTTAKSANKKNITAGNNDMRDEPADKYQKALHRRARDLSKYAEQESVVDNEKVNAIKAAIDDGTYRVNADNIAAKLIELEFELKGDEGDS